MNLSFTFPAQHGAHPMSAAPAISLSQSYHPTTFLERGVAVPFTTPMLAGTRARPASRGGPELIVPSPAGGRGVYILPWGSVQELCHPSVHDCLLNEKVAALVHVTPFTIRQAAREIAREGLAGREAQVAASTAAEMDHHERLLANFLLLLGLIQQVEPTGSSSPNLALQSRSEIEARARRTIAQIAPHLGLTPESIAHSLEELADLFAGVGIGTQREAARIPTTLRQLQRLRQETIAWARQHRDNSGDQAQLIADVAGITVACARGTLDQAQQLTDDPIGLLRRWRGARQGITQLASRPDWLLDGWSQISMVWDHADEDKAKPAALAEMALLAPIIPREVSDWVGPAAKEDIGRFRRAVVLNEDWRTGVKVFDLIARNEHLRALAA
jgi:hypothetical protein